MSEQHREEQEMEAEALEAIFDTAFEIRSSEQPFAWAVKLMPVDCGGDLNEEEKSNHVMIKLIARIPLEYPEETLPQFDLEILKGLSEDNKKEILQLANQEAEANAGMPSIFAVCEAVRSWLEDNNVKGLDDASMHAQMMRKAKEAKRKEVSYSFTHQEIAAVKNSDVVARKIFWCQCLPPWGSAVACLFFETCHIIRAVKIPLFYRRDIFTPARYGESWNVTEG